jgi:hypothetical protein
MSIEFVRSLLLWCTIINFGLYLLWVGLFTQAHSWLSRGYCRRFHVSSEQFDGINYAGVVLYKLAILLFNPVPYIALRIAG